VKSDDELKALDTRLKARAKELAALAKAARSGNVAALEKAAAADPTSLALVESARRYLCKRLGVTYMLLSELDGSPKTFDADKPIHLHVALVNRETGRFRYYAHNVGKRSDLPAKLEGLVTIMAQNVFGKVGISTRSRREATRLPAACARLRPRSPRPAARR
jgi:hypothetical protein